MSSSRDWSPFAVPILETTGLTSTSTSAGTSAAFTEALQHAIALLRSLPRAPGDTADARERLRNFAAAHPATSPEFLIDLAPGGEHADFDIYLEHPAGGTVGVTFRENAGRPWFVDYSEHWAANYVLHVGTLRVTVQEAMFALQYLSERDPGLVRSLVRDTLVAEAGMSDEAVWAGNALDVSPQEVQEAADAFRYAHHLKSAADTHAWLEQMGWSTHRFQSVLASGVRLRKMEERLVAGRIESHFEAHRRDFDMVHVFRTECDLADTSEILARMAAEIGLMTATQRMLSEHPGDPRIRVNGALTMVRAYMLDAAVRTATPGEIVGPVELQGRHVVAQVLACEPATTLADTSTRRAVRERLVEDWVVKRAHDVPVRWNWT